VILSFDASQELSVAFAAIACIAAVALIVIYIPMLRRLYHALSDSPAPESGTLPVSVIVYTYANSKGLEEVIKALHEQHYDGSTEIIVVNDGKDNGVEDFLTTVENTYPGLRRTFTPYDTRNISRKKLALTLGIKAAHNPIVLFLTSESRLPGPCWLSSMTAPFHNREIDLVLGYAGPGASDTESHRLSRGMRHDILVGDMEWLSDAIDGKPWRGDGDNIGIRRSMFFNNMGFGNSLNLQYGDDDVFVSEVATGSNTAVVLSPDSRVSTEAPDDTPGYYRIKRERHRLMEGFCSKRPNTRIAATYVLPWIWFLSTIAASVCILGMSGGAFSGTNTAFSCAVLGGIAIAGIALWSILGIAFNRVEMALEQRHLRWSLPYALLSRPIRRWSWHKRKAPRSWQQPC